MSPKIIGYAVLVVVILSVMLAVKVWRGEITVNPVAVWVVVIVGLTGLWIAFGPEHKGTSSASYYYHEDDDYRSRGRR